MRILVAVLAQVAARGGLAYQSGGLARGLRRPRFGVEVASAKMPEVPVELQEEGLKVPATAWKWPGRWPYASDGFDRAEASGSSEAAEAILDAAAKETLREHLAKHAPGGVVVEIDATGTGESYVADARRVTEAEWLTWSETTPFEDESVDAVVLLHAAETAQSPRALFRDVWRVLKPGGRCIVAFSSAKFSPARHAANTIKMWKDYNDAQRLYIVGSYFHFSAGAPAAGLSADGLRADVWGAGWRNLRGYDYLGSADKTGLLDRMTLDDSKVPLLVVQADKAPPAAPGDGALAVMDAALWLAPHAEIDDKRLFATRLLSITREFGLDEAAAERLATKATEAFPLLYETLTPMSTVVATPLLAQLAANLAPSWNVRSLAQPAALREGFGLDPPRDAFWKPLGELTPALLVDDKLWLLTDLLPLFDEAAHPASVVDDDGYTLPDALNGLLAEAGPLCAAIDTVEDALLADVSDRDAQLLAVDLVCRDYLPDAVARPDDTRAAAADFRAWLDTLSKRDLETFLDERKNYRDIAKANADLADLDPEAAAKAADDKRRAAAVEAMLNDIAKQLQAKKAAAANNNKVPF